MLGISDIATIDALKAASKGTKRSGPGIDGVTPKQYRTNLMQRNTGVEVIKSIVEGTYKPMPLKKKLIPKPNGKHREICIPTAQDRVIQRMLVRALNPIMEKRFLDQSYGFRPRRNVQQAVAAARMLIAEGYKACVLLDLENFFGNIDRDRLRKLLRDYELKEEVRKLINEFMKAKVIGENRSPLGIPAGIPLAPLLANLYLHPLDKELQRKRIHFIRYADDITLFFKTENECHDFINAFRGAGEQRFGIKINHEKTKIISTDQRPILGFNLDDSGGVTCCAKVTDDIRESLIGLFAAPDTSLDKIAIRAKQTINSFLAHYKCADNHIEMRGKCQTIQNEVKEKIFENFPILEIISKANLKLCRIDECDYFVDEALEQLIPSL